MKIWNFTWWNVSGVNDTIGYFLFQSLPTKDLWERESLTRMQRPQPRPRHQQHQRPPLRPPHQSQCPPLSRTYRLLQLVPLHLPQDSLRLSLQQLFLRGQQKGKGKQQLEQLSVRLGQTNLRKEDDTVFGHTSWLDSKNVANKLRHGGFIISFMKFIIILIFTMTDLAASNDVIIIFSGTHWGTKLNFSSFLNFTPWFVYKLSTSVIPLKTRLQQLEWYRGNFKVSPA